MSTEYTFDGLDEWEKNLAQVIDQQYPEEFKQMVIDIAERTLGRAKELTPVQTGHLRNAWNLGTIEKRGDTYYIEIYNNVEYAEPVEYGHRGIEGKKLNDFKLPLGQRDALTIDCSCAGRVI